MGASYLGVHMLPRDWWCLGGVRVYKEPPVLQQSPCDHLWRHILERKPRVVMLLHYTFPKRTALSWTLRLLKQLVIWKSLLPKAVFLSLTTEDWSAKCYWKLLWALEDVQWHPRPSLARYQHSNQICIYKLTHAPSQAKSGPDENVQGHSLGVAAESGNWAAVFLPFCPVSSVAFWWEGELSGLDKRENCWLMLKLTGQY